MPYPVSPTEFRTPAHGASNAADRVCLATLGFTGERGRPLALTLLETLTLSETRAQAFVRKSGETLAFTDGLTVIGSGLLALTVVTASARGDAIQQGGGAA